MAAEMAPTAPLRASLASLADTLEGFSFRLPGPHQAPREEERSDLVWSIREYLIPRLGDLGGPVVAVMAGSTGSGKSTLVNSLAQAKIGEVGAIRPTTLNPVVWTHGRHQDRYRDDFLDGYGRSPGAAKHLDVVPGSDPLLENLSVLDVPDIDSVVVENRQMADELLAIADLCVFVTTAQRYADAIPWSFLEQAQRRGLPLLFVVNRLPPGPEARRQILADYARRLAEHGVLLDEDPSLLFAIAEQDTDPEHGGLPAEEVAHIRRELGLLSDPEVRRQLVRQSTEGAVSEVIDRGRRVASMLEDERREVEGLMEVARLAYRAQMDEVRRLLYEGSLIREQVLERWQEFVGTGDLWKSLNTGASTVRRWARTVFGGQAPPVEQVGGEAKSELVAAITRRADLGARAAAAAWEADPSGKVLLEEAGGRALWRHDEGTPGLARRALQGWMSDVSRMIGELGEGKQRTARMASFGVNAAAVVVLIAVFSQTGGITGAELGITAGAAAVQQKLLEHLFGSAAARSLIERARGRLEEALDEVLMADAARFLAAARSLLPPQGLASEIREQVRHLSGRAGDFYGR